MKKASKIILILFGILAIIVIVLAGCFCYITIYKVSPVDTAQSPDGAYEVILQSVGEPKWPFGSASGRLVLKKEEQVISETNIEIANDGAFFSKRNWSVTWYDEYVEIILSGEEQFDELVTLYFDGQVESARLMAHYGVEKESVSEDSVEVVTEAASETELFPDEQQITAGYAAIYGVYSDSSLDDFEVYYGASESSSRCILAENESTIDYLVYNGESENEQCGLYVHYRSEKNADGTWYDTDGIIIDIYAYVYENNQVVSSGKTQWEDVDTETYILHKIKTPDVE